MTHSLILYLRESPSGECALRCSDELKLFLHSIQFGTQQIKAYRTRT